MQAAEAALDEYDLWSASPCDYIPPAPPAGSTLPAVPNPVLGTASCSPANKFDLFKLTKGTPPAETFEKWAGYRDPKALVKHANDARIRVHDRQGPGGRRGCRALSVQLRPPVWASASVWQ